MVLKDQKACYQYGGLQEGGQAQTDDLLTPLDEAIGVSTGNGKHIQAADCNLDEQNAATLEIRKEYLDDGISHQDDTEQHHNGAGQSTKAWDGRGRDILCQTIHKIEV